MVLYIDSEYRLHTENDGSMREVNIEGFEDKCSEYIEGYRYVPPGETWLREDGVAFGDGMLAPWKDHSGLRVAQLEYELADADEALREVGVANG